MKPSEIPAYVAELQERVLEKDTPYNTYVVDGLPPTPIANPGRAALEAVANPSRTNDLYFIADGTGGHAFAETLEDHKRNITRWQRVRAGQQQTEESAAPAITPRPVPTTSFPGRVEKRTGPAGQRHRCASCGGSSAGGSRYGCRRARHPAAGTNAGAGSNAGISRDAGRDGAAGHRRTAGYGPFRSRDITGSRGRASLSSGRSTTTRALKGKLGRQARAGSPTVSEPIRIRGRRPGLKSRRTSVRRSRRRFTYRPATSPLRSPSTRTTTPAFLPAIWSRCSSPESSPTARSSGFPRLF